MLKATSLLDMFTYVRQLVVIYENIYVMFSSNVKLYLRKIYKMLGRSTKTPLRKPVVAQEDARAHHALAPCGSAGRVGLETTFREVVAINYYTYAILYI
jgi:hypothetical protein